MLKKLINLLKTILVIVFTRRKFNYNTWVFSSSFNTKFNYNSKYLFEHVYNNEPLISPLYVINDDILRKQLKEKYGEEFFIETKSFKGIKRVLNAGVWFTSAGLPSYGLRLNKKRLIINLWHGVPLKKIALLEEKVSKVNKVYFKYIFSKNYSFIITTSNKLISVMQKSFGVDKNKIKVLGQPRNDVLYIEKEKKQVLQKLYSQLPSYTKAILYAPTYRDNGETVLFPFKDFDMVKLNEFLKKNDMIIFIRSHQSDNSKVINFGNRVKFINEDIEEDIMNIINIFDLLITDYSSIYIDFLLMNKPIMFLPYDKNQYLEERGFNFNYDDVTPGPKPSNLTEFMDELSLLIKDKKYYLSDRIKTNNYFNEIKENSSEKIVVFAKKEIKKLNN